MSLDPDDPRPPFRQVAQTLRARILTGQLGPGQKLPSQNQLAAEFGVARATVQDALRELRDEGLTVSRQGSGVYVKARTERPVGLRPHIELAFERSHVAIDFAGFSGETLYNAIQEPLDKIRIGRFSPESIMIRMLLSDMSNPVALPVRAEDRADDPAIRARAARIQHRYTQSIMDAVHEQEVRGLVKSATVEVRTHGCAPLFKLYVLNNEHAFFGYYPVSRHAVTLDGSTVEIFDPMGKDAILFQNTTTDDDTSTASQHVEQARTWFDSMWSTIAHEFKHES